MLLAPRITPASTSDGDPWEWVTECGALALGLAGQAAVAPCSRKPGDEGATPVRFALPSRGVTASEGPPRLDRMRRDRAGSCCHSRLHLLTVKPGHQPSGKHSCRLFWEGHAWWAIGQGSRGMATESHTHLAAPISTPYARPETKTATASAFPMRRHRYTAVPLASALASAATLTRMFTMLPSLRTNASCRGGEQQTVFRAHICCGNVADRDRGTQVWPG